MPGRSLRAVLPSGVLFLCAACATPYQARDLNGFGYSFQQIGTGDYTVSFTANTATGFEQIQDFALLRAAQIGATLGYSYVEVLDRSSEEVTLPAVASHTAGTPAPSGSPSTVHEIRDVVDNRRRRASLHVRFIRHATDATGIPLEDVQATLARLSEKYSVPRAAVPPAGSRN